MNCINKNCSAELVSDAAYCHICGRKQAAERKHIKRANGTGTVIKMSGRRKKPWCAKKSGVLIGYYEQKKDAENALNALSGRDVSERHNMTFAEVFEEWKAEHYRDVSESMQTTYTYAFSQFAELHGKPFRSLQTADFQRCVDIYTFKGGTPNSRQPAGKARAHSTVSKLKQLIGQMSRYAIRERAADVNFAPYIRLPALKKAPRVVFTDSDIEKLKGSRDDAAKIILMLIYTGMRTGELFSMRCKDVYDTHCIGGEKTEAGRNRIIPIPDAARPYFSYFLKESAGMELLLGGYIGNGSDLKNFRTRDYYPLLDSLAIERKPPKSTRSTYATHAAKQGMRQEHLQKILGHTRFDITADYYIHADMDALIAAANAVYAKKAKE